MFELFSLAFVGYDNCLVLGIYASPQYAIMTSEINNLIKRAWDSMAMQKRETAFYAFLASFNFSSIMNRFFFQLRKWTAGQMSVIHQSETFFSSHAWNYLAIAVRLFPVNIKHLNIH